MLYMFYWNMLLCMECKYCPGFVTLQYRVYPLRARRTACKRLGILSTRACRMLRSRFCHSSCNTWPNSRREAERTFRLFTARCRACHRCSIGFRSGDIGGWGSNSTSSWSPVVLDVQGHGHVGNESYTGSRHEPMVACFHVERPCSAPR